MVEMSKVPVAEPVLQAQRGGVARSILISWTACRMGSSSDDESSVGAQHLLDARERIADFGEECRHVSRHDDQVVALRQSFVR